MNIDKHSKKQCSVQPVTVCRLVPAMKIVDS